MTERQELFTAREAAAYLRYEPTTLAIWRSEARGPAYIKSGRSIRYRRRDLDEWIDGGPAVQTRIEEAAECHVEKRKLSKRLRGRKAVELRERKLAAEPHCRDCREQGRERWAEEIDHIIPLDDGGSNDDENLRSLCRLCHRNRTSQRWAKKS